MATGATEVTLKQAHIQGEREASKPILGSIPHDLKKRTSPLVAHLSDEKESRCERKGRRKVQLGLTPLEEEQIFKKAESFIFSLHTSHPSLEKA